jgi:hypothetical protein
MKDVLPDVKAIVERGKDQAKSDEIELLEDYLKVKNYTEKANSYLERKLDLNHFNFTERDL